MHLWALWALIMTCLSRYAHWSNNHKNILGVTSYFLVWVKTYSTKWNSYPAQLSSKEPVSRQVIITRGEPNANSQTNEHGVKRTPVDECISQSSSERLFVVEGDEHKEPYIINMQRITDSRIFSLKWYI